MLQFQQSAIRNNSLAGRTSSFRDIRPRQSYVLTPRDAPDGGRSMGRSKSTFKVSAEDNGVNGCERPLAVKEKTPGFPGCNPPDSGRSNASLSLPPYPSPWGGKRPWRCALCLVLCLPFFGFESLHLFIWLKFGESHVF